MEGAERDGSEFGAARKLDVFEADGSGEVSGGREVDVGRNGPCGDDGQGGAVCLFVRLFVCSADGEERRRLTGVGPRTRGGKTRL
jgi:hypothetical protein